MAKYTIFKLKNLTPLHIGTGKENYDFSASELQSDTLSAALAAMRVQKGDSDDIKEFMNSFVISSAFPFVGDRFFLLKMSGKLNVSIPNEEEHSYRKRLKKVKFVDVAIWNDLISKGNITIAENQIQDEFLVAASKGDFASPYKSQVTQRVSIPREEGKDADPFFFNWTYYSPDSGLYCIVDAEEPVLNELEELFVMLGENGLGTDKNIGGGKFEVERIDSFLEIADVADANSSMLLSMYIPTEEELGKLNLANSRYDLIHRGGYMAGSDECDFRHLRKKTIYMFSSGSIFSTTEKLTGKVVDLKPIWNDERMHPVYRSGKPFVVPIKLTDNE